MLLIDQILLKETYQRFIAFLIFVIRYANSVATITVLFTVIISLLMHVIINNDFI